MTTEPPKRPWLLVTTSLTVVVWIAFLACQAVWYSNPVVVSRPQLLTAPIVVEGELLADPPRLQIERVWWGELAPKTIAIHMNQQDALQFLREDRHFVAPLVQGKEETYYLWRNGAGERAIYPATPSVKRQIEPLLAHRRSRSSEGAVHP